MSRGDVGATTAIGIMLNALERADTARRGLKPEDRTSISDDSFSVLPPTLRQDRYRTTIILGDASTVASISVNGSEGQGYMHRVEHQRTGRRTRVTSFSIDSEDMEYLVTSERPRFRRRLRVTSVAGKRRG